MTFVFSFVLGGLVLVSIPVLIHLIMRQKPKTLLFPAFRFLVQRHRTNLRKLRLRHLLLLSLRVLLIVAICLAAARLTVSSDALKLGTDRPVAAVLLFDTSPSMEYTVSTKDGKLTRLDDAKRRGHEMIDRLPAGSKYLILDTAEAVPAGKGDWLTSALQARKRIDALRVRPGGTVTARLEEVYRLLADLGRARDEQAHQLARLVCVFSDRTTGGWDAGRVKSLQEARDRVPLPFDRVALVGGRIPGVIELLKELRTRVPVSTGQELPDAALIDLLDRIREEGGRLSEAAYPDSKFNQLVGAARGRARELLAALEGLNAKLGDEAKQYRDRVLEAVGAVLHDLRGAHEVFLDVGVDDPADGAILDLELPRDGRRNAPRQLFAADEKFVVRATVQATGKDLSNVLRWTLGARKEEQAVEIKAGSSKSFAFPIDGKQLQPGPHQLVAEFVSTDLLPANNLRYLTFAIRQPRQVLVLTDQPPAAQLLKDAHDAVGDFRLTIQKIEKALKEGPDLLRDYHAVWLFNVEAPSDDLWRLLEGYVNKGGGLAVVPGGPTVVVGRYNSPAAQAVLPGKLGNNPAKAASEEAGRWDWDKLAYQHALMAPFRTWKGDRGIDFVRYPRSATWYWPVAPREKDVTALAAYAARGSPPALLERLIGAKGGRPGKVILFTTTMDLRDRAQAWNNYAERLNSFYVVLANLTTGYLAGDTQPVRLNFLSGQESPVVPLPLAPRFKEYALWRGPDLLDTVAADETLNELRFPQAAAPGNYAVAGEGKKTAFFSVNLTTEEALLTRVPVKDVEAVFGRGSVLPLDVQAELGDSLSGHWSQPVELFPFLMVLLLLVLAVENLLANRFYRREPEPAG
ncbi:MAG: BatA domain-containing protein [Gemmataceae bacterium]|nr:BatA domain-containing protein [Gemmataceae bacterium]